ncbi:MAG: glycosyltransferase [Methanobacteriota archaeon]
MARIGPPGDGRPRVAVVAYTEYAWDPRVRREAEGLVEDGYVVHAIVVRPLSAPSASHLGGVHVHELPLAIRRGGKIRYAYQYAMFLLLSTVLLVRLHATRPFRLVHVHSLPDFQVLCALPLRLLGVAVLLDLHEAMPEILAARFRLPPRSAWVRAAAALERLSALVADHVIVANDAIRAAVVARGLRPERVTAVYNPGDTLVTSADAPDLLRGLALPSGRLIVHAGGVNRERDLETLLRAVARLPPEAEGRLVIAGDGDPSYADGLRRLASDLGLSERVRFVGRLSPEQAHALMARSAVGVVSLEANPLTELAFPTRIAEFARLRKPLIVPRLAFLHETLEDAAQYYDPGDAAGLARELELALVTPGVRAAAVVKAATICGRFEWSRMRSVLRDVYRSVEVSRAI